MTEITDADREAAADCIKAMDLEPFGGGVTFSLEEVQEAFARVRAAFAAGQEKERADVVAWLEDCNDDAAEALTDAIVGEAIKQHKAGEFASYPFLKLVIDAIARGEHKSLPEPDRNSQTLAD